jgi:hypothetical protein
VGGDYLVIFQDSFAHNGGSIFPQKASKYYWMQADAKYIYKRVIYSIVWMVL